MGDFGRSPACGRSPRMAAMNEPLRKSQKTRRPSLTASLSLAIAFLAAVALAPHEKPRADMGVSPTCVTSRGGHDQQLSVGITLDPQVAVELADREELVFG